MGGGGWDTHSAQNARLATHLRNLDAMVAALREGLGGAWSNTRAVQTVGCADRSLSRLAGLRSSTSAGKCRLARLWSLAMQIKVSLAISGGTSESNALPLLTLEVDAQPSIETLGLGLADAKALLARMQAQIVTRQVDLLSSSQRRCESCGQNRAIKDYHDVHYRSLFGSVVVKVPRWRRCECRLSTAPSERRARPWISAELEYVQSRLAATIPYAKSSELLELLLPVAGANATSTVRRHTLDVGRRLDAQGLEVQPHARDMDSGSNVTTVGLDGGYLRLCHPDEEKSFEVVAGRATRAGVGQRSVAFVRAVDPHSHARVRGVLAAFGGHDRSMEVFTDGDIQLRQWQL